MTDDKAPDPVDALRRQIIELDLLPGSELQPGDVAEGLGIRPAVVRDALAQLQREGLVVPIAVDEWQVSPVTLPSVKELFEVRAVLESEAAALAAASAADIEHLRELDRLCVASYDVTDPATITAFLRRNTDFHVGIAATANRRLASILRQVLEEQERVFHLLLRTTLVQDLVVHEHKELLAAIVAGNPRAARQVALSQAAVIRQRTVEALVKSHLAGEPIDDVDDRSGRQPLS